LRDFQAALDGFERLAPFSLDALDNADVQQRFRGPQLIRGVFRKLERRLEGFHRFSQVPLCPLRLTLMDEFSGVLVDGLYLRRLCTLWLFLRGYEGTARHIEGENQSYAEASVPHKTSREGLVDGIPCGQSVLLCIS
jgi:hypothetical protein